MDIQEVKILGQGLLRPEGVMATDDGRIFAADARGRCSCIEADWRIVTFFGNLGGLPNGICIDTKGHCIVANIGNGEVQSLAPDGTHKVLMTEAGGKKMLTPNFPFLDFAGRLWVSNSTDNPDIDASLRNPVPDGCLVMIATGEPPRIVADGIYFANGVALDAKEEYVYVAETMQRRVLRFPIRSDNSVGAAEVYGPDSLGQLGFPDGIAFDEAGNLWVAFPVANALGYIDTQGRLQIYVQDLQGTRINRPANICFGGPGRRTAYIGSLSGSGVPYFEVPHPGMRLVHQK